MRETLVIKIESPEGGALLDIKVGSGWPAWKGVFVGYDPLFNGWKTATQAVEALKTSIHCPLDCLCWSKWKPLLAYYVTEQQEAAKCAGKS